MTAQQLTDAAKVKDTIDNMRRWAGDYDSDDLLMVRAFGITALLDEGDRLRKVIDVHNSECLAQCGARQLAGSDYCPMVAYKNRACADCPKNGMTVGGKS